MSVNTLFFFEVTPYLLDVHWIITFSQEFILKIFASNNENITENTIDNINENIIEKIIDKIIGKIIDKIIDRIIVIIMDIIMDMFMNMEHHLETIYIHSLQSRDCIILSISL